VNALQRGETVVVVGWGESMIPRIRSGEPIVMAPVKSLDKLRKGMVVLAKVNGRIFLHKITAIKGNRFQISSNRGHVNGWTSTIYGKMLGYWHE
jgi:hypothetical protein